MLKARRDIVTFAALLGLIGVLAGTFAAHGLDPVADARRIGWLATGSTYQLLHVAAALAALALERRLAAWTFLAGATLFPLALYGLAAGGPTWLGVVAPIGGTLFLAGWIVLGIGSWRSSR